MENWPKNLKNLELNIILNNSWVKQDISKEIAKYF